MIKRAFCIFLVMSGLFAYVTISQALTPEQVVVVANKKAWSSCKLAKYYMEKRHIPASNLIRLKALQQFLLLIKDILSMHVSIHTISKYSLVQ